MALVDERQFESKHNNETLQNVTDHSLDLMTTNIVAVNDYLPTSEITYDEQKKIIEKWKNTVSNYKAFFEKFAEISRITTDKTASTDTRDSLTSTHVLQQLHNQYTTLINKIERLTNQSLLETFDELQILEKEVCVLNADLLQHSEQIKTYLQAKQKQPQPQAIANDSFYPIDSQQQHDDISLWNMEQTEEEKIATWDDSLFDPNMQIDLSYPQDESMGLPSSEMQIDNTQLTNELSQQPIQPLPPIQVENTLQQTPDAEEHKSEQETIDQEFKNYLALLTGNFGSLKDIKIIDDKLIHISPKSWADKNSNGQTLLMHMLQDSTHGIVILGQVIKKIAANEGTAKSFAICDSEQNTVLHAMLSHEPMHQYIIKTSTLGNWMEIVIKNCPELVKQTNKNQQTPLHLAAQKWLLENKYICPEDEFFNHIEHFLRLAKKYNSDLNQNDMLNAEDSKGTTVFDYAIQNATKYQNTRLIEKLLQYHIISLSDKNIDNLKKLAPNHHYLQQILTQTESYCHQFCPSPLTPELMTSKTAHFADFVNNNNDLLRALFNTGHFFSYLPKEINDPLCNSKIKDSCYRSIVKQPGIVNAQNNKGQTPLHLAIFALSKYPADFSEARNHYAVSVCQYICILNQILNKCKVNLTLDLNIRDKEGKTPLDYAIELNSHDILVNYLLQNGARAHCYQHDARYCKMLQSHISPAVIAPPAVTVLPPAPNMFANGLTLFQPASTVIAKTVQSSVSPAYNSNQN